MGEAKRRKRLDPLWGKSKELKTEIFLTESEWSDRDRTKIEAYKQKTGWRSLYPGTLTVGTEQFEVIFHVTSRGSDLYASFLYETSNTNKKPLLYQKEIDKMSELVCQQVKNFMDTLDEDSQYSFRSQLDKGLVRKTRDSGHTVVS